MIVSGGPPDSPTNRIDPNTVDSPFSGVVSINIRYNIGPNVASFICSGTMISPRHVLTAAHCVDATDLGDVIDISDPAVNDVRVVLNASDVIGDPLRGIISATRVSMHPDYNGFGICPPNSGLQGQCLNDDIAILELATDVPEGIKIYDMSRLAPTDNVFTMVGYGTTGDGINGYLPNSANFRIKRDGKNVWDLYETDDEALYDPNSMQEVWYYDFDGDAFGYNRDAWCELEGICNSPQLGNLVETHIGGGDSGGPSFVMDSDGNYILVANNTFGGNVCGWPDANGGATPCRNGDFGDIGGGILLYSYYQWIRNTVPEPGTLALMGLALVGLAGVRRRRR